MGFFGNLEFGFKMRENSEQKGKAPESSEWNGRKLTKDEKQALYGPDTAKRCEAVRRISDNEILMHLAESDGNEFVRYAAIDTISDETLLHRIRNSDAEESFRKAALLRMSDQDMLYDAALHDRSSKLRSLAAKKLDEAHNAALVYREDASVEQRMDAALRLKGEADLAKIVGDEQLLRGIRLKAAAQLEKLHPAAAEKLADTVGALRAEKERADQKRAEERSRRKEEEAKHIRHIVCLCYDAPYINSLKPEMQQYIVAAEEKRGKVITPTSRISFDSFGSYNNAALDDPAKICEKIWQLYAPVYGFAESKALVANTVEREVLERDGHTLVRFFVLYEG